MNQKITLGARLLFGIIFLIFGLNGFFNFIPVPPPPEAGMKFLGALAETGYMFPVIKGLEVLVGVALLAGLFVPLALVVIAPIVVNIFLYHVLLAPEGAALAVVLIVLNIFLGWSYRSSYSALLKAK